MRRWMSSWTAGMPRFSGTDGIEVGAAAKGCLATPRTGRVHARPARVYDWRRPRGARAKAPEPAARPAPEPERRSVGVTAFSADLPPRVGEGRGGGTFRVAGGERLPGDPAHMALAF